MSCNMPFVNVILDVGAVMNAYKFVWSNLERFQNVIIHLGDFHFIKENFQVSSHLVFWDSVSLCPGPVDEKLWLWSWSVHFPSSRILIASRFRKSGEEKYFCSLLTDLESVIGSLVFSFGFPKPETLCKLISKEIAQTYGLKSGLGHRLRFSVSVQLYWLAVISTYWVLITKTF